MDNSFDIYLERVEKLCRVCRERSIRDQTRKPRQGEINIFCDKYAKYILIHFIINITNDIHSAHSKGRHVAKRGKGGPKLRQAPSKLNQAPSKIESAPLPQRFNQAP